MKKNKKKHVSVSNVSCLWSQSLTLRDPDRGHFDPHGDVFSMFVGRRAFRNAIAFPSSVQDGEGFEEIVGPRGPLTKWSFWLLYSPAVPPGGEKNKGGRPTIFRRETPSGLTNRTMRIVVTFLPSSPSPPPSAFHRQVHPTFHLFPP